MQEVIINLKNVSKTFRYGIKRTQKRVLDCLNLKVMRGESVGFLGINGAGKTTTIKIIMGFLKPDRGIVNVFERVLPDNNVYSRIGFMPEIACYYKFLNTYEILRFYGKLHGLRSDMLNKKIHELVSRMNLKNDASRRLKTYSKGMLQRVGFACALIHVPELLILDEPMSGLDPLGRKIVKEMIREQKDLGKTIFFTSHIIPDVEELSTKIAVLEKGSIRHCGYLDNMINSIVSYDIGIRAPGIAETTPLKRLASSIREDKDGLISLEVEGTGEKNEVVRWSLRNNYEIAYIQKKKISLEDILFPEHSDWESKDK